MPGLGSAIGWGVESLFKASAGLLKAGPGKLGKSIYQTAKTIGKETRAAYDMKGFGGAAENIAANAKHGTTAAMDSSLGVLGKIKSGFDTTRGGKIFNGSMRAGKVAGKFATRNPLSRLGLRVATSTKMLAPAIVGGLAFGSVHGAARSVMQQIDDRRTVTARGMDPNNLGTDGLTLALSKRRHR